MAGSLKFLIRMDPRIARVIAVMEADFENRQSIAALAARVNLSPSRLVVLFRRDAGVTPARYLRALRMERARLLLERTFLTVKEVMTFVGVTDPSHFTRDFRRHYGVPPTRLRRRSWAAQAAGLPPDRTRETASAPARSRRRATATPGETAADARGDARTAPAAAADGPADRQQAPAERRKRSR
jgi:AraC-like DNA-binding protein